MPDFNVKAKDKNGNDIRTQVTANNQSTAAKLLINKGLFPVSIDIATRQEELISRVLPFVGHIGVKDKVIFSRQLATMVNAGLPLVQSLNTLAGQTKSKKFAAVISKIAKDVEGGQSLASGLAAYPDAFDPLFISMIKAGEESGTMDKVLLRLADQMEKSYNLLSKVRNALVYPVFVVGLVLIIMIFMTVFVLPQFESFYASLDEKLPLPTLVLLAISHIIIKLWPVLIIGLLAGVFLVRRFLKTDKGRLVWDPIKLKLPIVKNLLRMIYMSRFSRTFGTLIGAGVPVLDAMTIVSQSVNNTVYERAILKAAAEVKRGTPLSKPLKEDENFPVLVSQMIAVGEQTGELDTILFKLADFYDNEIDNLTKNLSTLVEPILLVVLGIMVMIFIIAIIYPIYGIVFKFAGSGGRG